MAGNNASYEVLAVPENFENNQPPIAPAEDALSKAANAEETVGNSKEELSGTRKSKEEDSTSKNDDVPLEKSFVRTKEKYGDKLELDVVALEEHMIRKFRLKILGKGSALFMYNGKCYEQSELEYINKLCQGELKEYRRLFTQSKLNDLIHYAIADADVLIRGVAISDHLDYLTLQDGLYKLDEGILIPHTSDIFTVNLLPYDYDTSAQCPRFLQFLDEIFLQDKGKIDFVQEAVGYIFHKSLPTPALFFLLGDGSNGKSVFINTISNLIGKDNTSNISLQCLSKEYYIVDLFQKMVNISGETPNKKLINTGILKAVTSADWVTGRNPYGKILKFRPYAKHFLAMNEAPVIEDTSHGMWRRIWVIDFPKVFSDNEMEPDLEQKLSLELSGIFNWALEGYRRLKENGFRFTVPQSILLAKQRYRKEIDSARSFIDENLVRSEDQNDVLKLSDLYETKYGPFCKERGMDCVSKRNFKKVLTSLGYKVDNSTRHSNQVYVFNVKLNNIEQ